MRFSGLELDLDRLRATLHYSKPIKVTHCITFNNLTEGEAEIFYKKEDNVLNLVVLGPRESLRVQPCFQYGWIFQVPRVCKLLIPTVRDKNDIVKQQMENVQGVDVIMTVFKEQDVEVDIVHYLPTLEDLTLMSIVKNLKEEEDAKKLRLPKTLEEKVVERFLQEEIRKSRPLNGYPGLGESFRNLCEMIYYQEHTS